MSRHHRRLSQRRLAAFRDEVLQAADYRCARCEAPAGLDLEAHHQQPVEVRPDLAYAPANGVALCADCHQDVHGRDPQRAEWRRWVYGEGITR